MQDHLAEFIVDGLDDLRQYENEADAAIAAMPIMALPARAVLAGLHYFLWVTQHAGLLGSKQQPGVSETATRRMGYLLPLLVRRQAEPFGASARDALDGFLKADPTGEQMAQLLSYAHFCEFMPEAHKKYYTVTTTREGFRLVLRSEWFEQMQARDILLSELALVFPFPTRKELDPVLRDIVRHLPNANWDLIGPLLGRKIEALLFSLAEPNLVAPEGMERIFGSGYSGFYRIRASILAYAELALEISMILGATSNRDNDGKGISDETLEWISCNVEAEWFVGLIARLSAADPGDVERFIRFFCVDFRQSPARHNGGDGLFPPFARFEKSFVFSPILILNFLHLRNAVFAFSTLDARTYANHVSHELEPVLIRQAIEFLRRSHPWFLRPGYEYAGGEIDLVVAGEIGPVLLIQAKGTLPPQGARLTERLADRIREGIGQVEKFRALEVAEQEAIASAAVGRPVAAADIRHGILARSCFGAPEIFDPALGIARITLPLLSLALGEMRARGERADIDALLLHLEGIELRYFVEADPRWEEGAISLAGRHLRVSLFKYDQDVVDMVRAQSWECSFIEEPNGGPI